MRTYEILDASGNITSTIATSQEYISLHYAEGFYRDIGEYVTPITQQSENDLSNLTQKRLISVGAFYDRFGVYKWDILADSSPNIQALIKDCSVRKHIDLDREDLLVALNKIITSGYGIDVDLILKTEPSSDELP